ncbi:hypothetical protein P700755_003033 [Psychroflexus torquis ATCC 700755]|uniref:Uncharacterized protein n=2 Tax=Psychroflexus TaxID=83612 RepID=K4IIQ9_PSYTT|nr:hypothetical protein P700755_003033 [Psychroflexus torquis ATCC 700755]
MFKKYNICSNHLISKPMETKSITSKEIKVQNIQLVDGEFTPSQASDIISALINQKINYHKIEGLQLWERDHNNDPKPLSNRINELEEEKRHAEEFIAELKAKGKNLKINGILNLSIAD